MSTIVITGARGYIGSALARRLANEGHVLRLVSRSLAAPRVEFELTAKIDHCAADLRDPQSWSRLLHGADAVVHLSSRTDLRAAEADPIDDEDINVQPVRALVEAAASRDNRALVIFASAVTIAGPCPQIPVDETAADRPCSVYDRHKLACETILGEATAHGIVRACCLRLSNVYGYGSASINANRGILNMMLNRAVTGEPLTQYGDGAYIRDFIHVEDVIEAFRLAMMERSVCESRYYVIASGRGHTLAQAYALIAEAALSHVGRCVEIIRVPEPPDLHPIERRSFVGESHLFQTRTGWQARFDLETGIRDYFRRARCAQS